MRYLLLLSSLLSLLLSGCGAEPLYQSQAYVFGTLVDVSIYGEAKPRAEQLTQAILQDFQGLHQRLHAWQKGSELYQLNQALAQGKTAMVSPELAAILQDAKLRSQQSQGLFNPAIGKLIQLWGFQRDEFTPVEVDKQQLQSLVQSQPNMQDLQIQGQVVSSKNPDVQLDLGGYAKGYALDRAARYLRSQHVKNALLNIGGNIIALGQHGEHAWRVGIQHPRQPGPMATLDLADGWAIGTSGDYQRYFERDGKRYCHIIDPRTGYPAQNTQAVTVLIPPSAYAGTLSDVASKPIFLSSDPAQAAKQMGVANVLRVDSTAKVWLTSAMHQQLQFTQPQQSYGLLQ
jgi:FAD:protein FMN transferase